VDPAIDLAVKVDPSSVTLPTVLPGAVDGAGRDAGTGTGIDPDDEGSEAGISPSRPRPTPARPPERPAPPVTPMAPGLDAATRADLASLAGCVEKVPCARGLLEWSRNRRLSQNELSQLKESANDCAKRCRLK
jgi:hypothetical protein